MDKNLRKAAAARFTWALYSAKILIISPGSIGSTKEERNVIYVCFDLGTAREDVLHHAARFHLL